MSEKTDPLDVIAMVDELVMRRIRNERSGLLADLFVFFDDPYKPLSPREFLHFWSSLKSEEEKMYYLDPASKYGFSRKMTQGQLEVLRQVARNAFSVRSL